MLGCIFPWVYGGEIGVDFGEYFCAAENLTIICIWFSVRYTHCLKPLEEAGCNYLALELDGGLP